MCAKKTIPKAKTEKFKVKKDFTHGKKEYKKDDQIELKSKKGIEFLQKKNII